MNYPSHCSSRFTQVSFIHHPVSDRDRAVLAGPSTLMYRWAVHCKQEMPLAKSCSSCNCNSTVLAVTQDLRKQMKNPLQGTIRVHNLCKLDHKFSRWWHTFPFKKIPCLKYLQQTDKYPVSPHCWEWLFSWPTHWTKNGEGQENEHK